MEEELKEARNDLVVTLQGLVAGGHITPIAIEILVDKIDNIGRINKEMFIKEQDK